MLEPTQADTLAAAPPELQSRHAALVQVLRRYQRLLVAYSGGADSSAAWPSPVATSRRIPSFT